MKTFLRKSHFFNCLFFCTFVATLLTNCSTEDKAQVQESVEIKSASQDLDEAVRIINNYYETDLASEDLIDDYAVEYEKDYFYVYAFRNGEDIYGAFFGNEQGNPIGVTFFSPGNDAVSIIDVNYGLIIQYDAPMEDCLEDESCAGCHYRIMMDIINSDGDMQAACDANPVCSAQVYLAATIHCLISH